ncbi:pre-mRNA 3' end processing protein WDR33 [Cyclospora cayetanensis]|uniref:Pre-mRNA 3' end processing protein WDR33 n=1 Tax=Cyclospora cayetanensis TaxID=88456 RepID=A0A6P5WD86_9EIME|nr:pre-mRNA 3' end processing protein WDR33 [Cyclospora cayetanensis]
MPTSKGDAVSATEAEAHRQGASRASLGGAPPQGPLSPSGGPPGITPTFVELVRLLPGPLTGQRALELYVHSKMTDLGFLPCEDDTTLAGTTSTKPGSLVMLPDGHIARVMYAPTGEDRGDGWSCTFTRPEWRVFALDQGQQQLVAGKRIRLSLGRVGGRAVLRADLNANSNTAVLLELPHDLAVADAATAVGRNSASTRDPLLEFDVEKLKSLESLLHERLAPLPHWGPLATSAQGTPSASGVSISRGGGPGSLVPSRAPPSAYTGGLPSVGSDDIRPSLDPRGLDGSTGVPWGSGGGGGSLVGPGHPIFGLEGDASRGGGPLPPGARYDPMGPLGTEPSPDHTPLLPYEGPGGPGPRGHPFGGAPLGPYGRGPPTNPFGGSGAGGGGFFM